MLVYLKTRRVIWYSTSMKQLTILLLVGALVIGIALFVSNDTSDVDTVSVQPIVDEMMEYTCEESDRYLAVIAQSDPTATAQLYVYKKDALPRPTPCAFYPIEPVVAEMVEATFLTAVFGEYLLTDTGTGPGIRTLTVYNLATGQRTLIDSYVQPDELTITPPAIISYWRPTSLSPTVENCNGYNEIIAQSFTPLMIALVEKNLSNGMETETESRCIATQ